MTRAAVDVSLESEEGVQSVVSATLAPVTAANPAADNEEESPAAAEARDAASEATAGFTDDDTGPTQDRNEFGEPVGPPVQIITDHVYKFRARNSDTGELQTYTVDGVFDRNLYEGEPVYFAMNGRCSNPTGWGAGVQEYDRVCNRLRTGIGPDGRPNGRDYGGYVRARGTPPIPGTRWFGAHIRGFSINRHRHIMKSTVCPCKQNPEICPPPPSAYARGGSRASAIIGAHVEDLGQREWPSYSDAIAAMEKAIDDAIASHKKACIHRPGCTVGLRPDVKWWVRFCVFLKSPTAIGMHKPAKPRWYAAAAIQFGVGCVNKSVPSGGDPPPPEEPEPEPRPPTVTPRDEEPYEPGPDDRLWPPIPRPPEYGGPPSGYTA